MLDFAKVGPIAASRLLWAASLMDAAVVFFLLELLRPAFGAGLAMIWTNSSRLAPELQALLDLSISVLFFLILLIVYWMVTEIIFGGRTIGRFVMRLRMGLENGGEPSALIRTRRGFHKVSTLGLSGLRFDRLARHDASRQIAWRSPLGRGQRTAADLWSLKVESGRSKGETYALNRLPSFVKFHEIRVGRDAGWAEVLLERDVDVSSRHAILRLKEGRWQIQDYGGGSGSSNHTFIDGKAIPKLRWVIFDPSKPLSVGATRLRILRS